jgi:polyisoprenoid-binding protein YceI
MNKFLSAVGIAAIAIPCAHAAPKPYSMITDHTDVVFEVSHAGYSMKHGWLREVSGTLQYDPEKIESSSVDITAKAASIDTNNAKREKALTSPSFFDAVQFPDLHFVSTKVTRSGADTLDVAGNMTMHGVTKPMVLHTKINKSAISPFSKSPTVGVTATGTLLRSDFGMTSMIPLIGDSVSITIDTEFVEDK